MALPFANGLITRRDAPTRGKVVAWNVLCRTWTASRALFLTQTSRFWTNVNNDDDIITITTTTFMSALRIDI